VALLLNAAEPISVVAGLHLLAFFAVALLCHGELAARKPDPQHLTAFYLWLSVGGVVGGLLNTFIAPFLFAKLGPVEYPLAIVLAALVRPPTKSPAAGFRPSDLIAPLVLAAVTAGLILAVKHLLGDPQPGEEFAELVDRGVRGAAMFGLPIAAAFALAWRPVRFALSLGAVLLVGSFAPNPHGTVLETSRNFFGTLRVTVSPDGQFTRLVHGTTAHGQQRIGTVGRPEPTTYYHRKGPLGHLFEGLPADRRQRVGAVGLGAGAAAAYAGPGETWTFYEIDPAVERIARDERYFTFLSTCPAAWDVVLGDARRQLLAAPDGSFDLLILDAFSSDAVPVHLLTKEAFELYGRKLTCRGVLAFHVSNRYLDLAPLVARVATAADPHAVVRWQFDTEDDPAEGKLKSIWVVVAKAEDDLPKLPDGRPDRRWGLLRPKPGPVWTDDFSHLLGVWKRAEE
ncbi:MAG: fused MFS/spermidine synthase, partial [Gemmataceae bacterium]